MIYDNVKRIREAKGVAVSKVAEMLGFKKPQGYYYLENGQISLSAERLNVIAKFLREDVAVFCDEKLTESVLERIKGEKEKLNCVK